MMFTGRAKVAAVGVFVATVSVLGLCFAAVWAGDYRQLNESKSAEISQPYEAQPAIHPQIDEKEEVSMRKTVLDLRGAMPEAIVELNARLDNVVLPTSEIQQLTNDDKQGLDEANKGHPGQCLGGSLAACVAKEKEWGTVLDCSRNCDAQEEPLQLPAAATGGKKLDKAQRICLNTQLNELDATYDTSLVDYKDKKGPDFVDGPVTKFSTAYANADADQSLADADFLKVAAAKANFDGLFFYLKTSHTIEICDFTADEANKEAVKANPVLFNLPESQCAKAISAVDDFETGAGIELLSECNEAVIEAPEPVAPEPACVDEDTTGNTAWEELKTIAEVIWSTKPDSCADIAKHCHNGPPQIQTMIQAVCHASCGTCDRAARTTEGPICPAPCPAPWNKCRANCVRPMTTTTTTTTGVRMCFGKPCPLEQV